MKKEQRCQGMQDKSLELTSSEVDAIIERAERVAYLEVAPDPILVKGKPVLPLRVPIYERGKTHK